MTRAHKLRAGILLVAVLAAVTVSVLLITHKSQAPPLSLVFERYGAITTMDPLTMDLSAQDVAFLQITNSGDKAYFVATVGGTNTYLPDSPQILKPFWYQGSYLPMCEFSDQPLALPISYASLRTCVSVAPHSALRLRIPLPPEGQKRKVAVICMAPPPGVRPFWTSKPGLIVLRSLPRAVAKKAMWREPKVMKVWCDREFPPRRETLENISAH
jgi:hypothetical protein